ncbi:MAG: tRNA (adenosine(37)-N6)-threonylcarbamoyltransferase complex dimerization subunit type 1 TsaB [Rickettsiales bacterium]|nr:tRNA (adenosine(37)-N6)-threonylcarbamoyltransferase complex dimerization subunit type 1 TsaB [Rickettsiales bacterium]|tara:strand:- start:1059 stop:1712 length:654 start_codon:yes stop_codon:yes gene_type:complete
MKIFYLLLNLSIEPFSFAIASEDKILFEKKQAGDYSFTENIIQAVMSASKTYELSLSDCKGIGVINGPGSYTGSRIAVSTANTLAQINECPVLGFNSIDIIAESLKPMKNVFITAIPSRKNEVTFATFSAADMKNRMSADIALKEDAFLDFLKRFEHDISIVGPLSSVLLEKCNQLTFVTAEYKELMLANIFSAFKTTIHSAKIERYVKPIYLHNAV